MRKGKAGRSWVIEYQELTDPAVAVGNAAVQERSRAQFEQTRMRGLSHGPAQKADTALAPTKGRALDHIGFEVKNPEAFCHKLEAAGVHFDVPFRKVPALGISVAFFTDPWGTYIELTEGLGKL